MSIIDDIPLNARSLSYRWDGLECSLEFDADYLTFTSKKWPNVWCSKTPLWRLLPHLIVDQSIPDLAFRRGRESRYLLIGAIVAYFSDFNAHAPLLAPALFLLGTSNAYLGFRKAWPLRKTKIMTEYGEEIAVVPHRDASIAQRRAFEDGLVLAVRRAKEEDSGE